MLRGKQRQTVAAQTAQKPSVTDSMATQRGPSPTSEPPASSYCSLVTDLYDNTEFYIYTNGGHEFLRKKIGSWVNVSKFFPLIEGVSPHVLEDELRDVKRRFEFSKLPVAFAKRYDGVWLGIKDARKFAKKHNIYKKVAPILSFDRVAKVKYCGTDFYEYFAHVNMDSHIRILRDVNASSVNMVQIFQFYKKLKNKKSIVFQERNFYNNYKASGKLRIRNDKTICGGQWVAVYEVKEYARKHGFLERLRPILDFQTSPHEAQPCSLEKSEGYCRKYWRPTSCRTDFYGYPASFGGGNAPKVPAAKKKGFLVGDLVLIKSISGEISRQGRTEKHQVRIVQRRSDGWVNIDSLIHISAILKLHELDYGKDDPYMLIDEELYHRDLVDSYPSEVVVCHKSNTLSGRWCSREDALAILSSFSLSKTPNGQIILDMLNNSEFDKEVLSSDSDQVDLIDEGEYELGKVAQDNNIVIKDSFFDQGAVTSEDDVDEVFDGSEHSDRNEPKNITSYSDDEEVTLLRRKKVPKVKSEPTEGKVHDRIFSSSSEEEEEEEEEDDDEDPNYSQPSKRGTGPMPASSSGDRTATVDSLFDEDDDQSFIPLEEVNQKVYEQNQQQQYQQYQHYQQQQRYDTSSSSSSQPKSYNQIQDEILKTLKIISKKLEDLTYDKTVGGSRKIESLLEDLHKFRALRPDILNRAKLTQTFKVLQAHQNKFTPRLDDLLKKWDRESKNGEFPSNGEEVVEPRSVRSSHPLPPQHQQHQQQFSRRPQSGNSPTYGGNNSLQPNGVHPQSRYKGNQFSQQPLPRQQQQFATSPNLPPPPPHQQQQHQPSYPTHQQAAPSNFYPQAQPTQYQPYPQQNTYSQQNMYQSRPLSQPQQPSHPPQSQFNRGNGGNLSGFNREGTGSHTTIPIPQRTNQSSRIPANPFSNMSTSHNTRQFPSPKTTQPTPSTTTQPRAFEEQQNRKSTSSNTTPTSDMYIPVQPKIYSQKRSHQPMTTATRSSTKIGPHSKPTPTSTNASLHEPNRPLSPPSNYLFDPQEPKDATTTDYNTPFTISEVEGSTTGERVVRFDNPRLQQIWDDPKLAKYKNLAHFENGVKQESIKRRKLLFEDNPDVSFSKRLFVMMVEKEFRKKRD